MIEKCFICKEILSINNAFLCEKHLKEICIEFSIEGNIIKKPTFDHHCQICGEYENREIISFQNWCYICNQCLSNAMDAYNIE